MKAYSAVTQGTQEWLELRLGIPTASQFHRLLTPKKLEPSSQMDDYLRELLAEWYMGEPVAGWDGSAFSERGHDLEDEARRWYAFHRELDVQFVGFLTDDDHTYGGSPDGLVGDDGLLEIKCYGAKHHLLCLEGKLPGSILQHQGNLYVSGREWIDVLAYHPIMPPVLVRLERDPKIHLAIAQALEVANRKLEIGRKRLDALKAAGGRIDGGDMVAYLEASLYAGVDRNPDAYDLEEIDEVRQELRQWIDAGIMDRQDTKAILDDLTAGNWSEVRAMVEHYRLAKTLIDGASEVTA